jgi:ribonuclease I
MIRLSEAKKMSEEELKEYFKKNFSKKEDDLKWATKEELLNEVKLQYHLSALRKNIKVI